MREAAASSWHHYHVLPCSASLYMVAFTVAFETLLQPWRAGPVQYVPDGQMCTRSLVLHQESIDVPDAGSRLAAPAALSGRTYLPSTKVPAARCLPCLAAQVPMYRFSSCRARCRLSGA
ncbi:hypothetical protein V8C35DRAFT_291449 [Trichoderma chlorosporum]